MRQSFSAVASGASQIQKKYLNNIPNYEKWQLDAIFLMTVLNGVMLSWKRYDWLFRRLVDFAGKFWLTNLGPEYMLEIYRQVYFQPPGIETTCSTVWKILNSFPDLLKDLKIAIILSQLQISAGWEQHKPSQHFSMSRYLFENRLRSLLNWKWQTRLQCSQRRKYTKKNGFPRDGCHNYFICGNLQTNTSIKLKIGHSGW